MSNFTLKSFEAFPLWLRKGPWSPIAHVYLFAVTASLFYVAVATDSLDNFQSTTNLLSGASVFGNPRLVSSVCGAYMLGVLLHMFVTIGYWPMASYTLISWTILTFRHLLRAVGAPNYVHEAIHFPAVAGAATTFTIWWLVLVPAIYYCIPTPTGRTAFVQMNKSPLLINVHCLNLPLCVLDHALGSRSFGFTDLWLGLAVGIAYLLFYLLVLDANGIHFYIILSPRTNLCFISYSAVLGVYFFIWRNWPSLIDFIFTF